jgi:hypothetical protein
MGQAHIFAGAKLSFLIKDFMDFNIIVLDLILFIIRLSCVPAFGRLDGPKRIYLRASVW